MGTHLFNRHTTWTVFVSLLVALGLGACSDVSNAPAPPPGPTVLTITSPATLPAGSIGIPYSTTLTATGGQQPFGWSIPSGQTPAPGLTMDSNGVISGTPTNTGSTTRTYRVVDSAQPTQSFETQLTIAINSVPQPQISLPASLPNGIVGTSYPVTLTASGGTPPYTTWTVTPALPAGLIFTPNGDNATITGIPQAPISSNYTFRVTDSFSPTPQTGERTYTLTISAAPTKLTITTINLPPGTVTQPYSHQLLSNGGTGTVTWSLASTTPNPILPALSLSSGGLLNGTPTLPAATNYAMRFRVQDSAFPADTDEKTLTITTSLPGPPSITIFSLPSASFNSSYNQTINVSGGTAPLTWGVISGGLPTGLILNSSTGQIAGTATATGTFDFMVRVTDAIPQSDTQALSITITAPTPPTITAPASLPPGTVTQTYPTTTLTASGGTAPLIWDPVVSPALPNGLSWDAATHTISGTPLNGSQGTTSHTFTVRDSTNPVLTGTRTYSLNISLPAPPNITTTSTSLLPNGTVNAAYSRTLTATGGTGALTWSIQSGTLPTGVTLNPSTGVISGTSSEANTFTFTPQVTDSLSQTDSTPPSLSITINAAPIPPNITTISTSLLPNGTVNAAYSRTLTATGGTGALTWSIQSGTLPTGVTLNPSTGVISGTSSAAGTFTFTPQVTDTLALTDTTPPLLSITIDLPAPPNITTTTADLLPNGLVNGIVAYSRPLTATGGSGALTWSIASGTLPTGLTLSPTTGIISGTPSVAGTFIFTPQATDTLLQTDLTPPLLSITIDP